jgi:hypothetical protein
VQKVLSNPQFAKMAEQIGQQMLQTDPQMQAMLETMKDPEAQQKMKEKMESLKDDPDVGPLITELETGGPAAMSKCALKHIRKHTCPSTCVRNFFWHTGWKLEDVSEPMFDGFVRPEKFARCLNQ